MVETRTISSSICPRCNRVPTALRNSGCLVNVVTKSGTNAVHGNLYEFFRNTKLNANPYCFTGVDGVPCDKPQFNQNQFGGTLGGPIIKDQTFFFTSYEGRRIRQGI